MDKQCLLNEIFNFLRIRIDKPDEGYCWNFQNYFHFLQKLKVRNEDFFELMQEICKDGIFTPVYECNGAPPTFELTKKGAKMLWDC